MSRYTGPRIKVMRALGVELPGLSRKSIANRPHPPGQHGLRPRKKSEFGVQLLEKQKLRFNYGVSERQLQRLFREAKADRGPTGHKLLELLERRLDNAVFRAGLAPTVPAARQLVSHRHVCVNGRPVTIPSIRLRIGDVLTLTVKAQRMSAIRESLAEPALTVPAWLARESVDDPAKLSVRVTRLPEAEEVPFPVAMQQVVEYYAVRL